MKAKRYVYEIANDAKSRFKKNEEVKRTIDSIVQMTEQGHLSDLMGAYYIVTVVDENYWGNNEE
jgi:hypothetical protein